MNAPERFFLPDTQSEIDPRHLSSAVGRDAAARQYPLPGIGSADELAALMVWLLSEQAAHVTGQVWSLDAGFSSIRPMVN